MVQDQNPSKSMAEPQGSGQAPPWSKAGDTDGHLRQQLKAAFTDTYLEHCAGLDYRSEPNIQRLCGIICTIGPASREPEVLVQMFEAGMRIARLNFSHGSHEYHAETINNLHKAVQMYSQKLGYVYPLAFALDTRGPEIRTGLLEGGGSAEVELVEGNRFVLTVDEAFQEKGTVEKVYIDYQNIHNVVKPGDRIFIDDGLLAVIVEEIKGPDVITKVEAGGSLGSRKGCNLPGVATDLPGITEKDAKDLKFGAEQNVDFVFASFIRDGKTVTEMRECMGEKGKGCMIISKIECVMGMDNIDEIIAASDGIMIARGDLGIEIPPEKVFLAQKMIFAKCNMVGKPCVCATQMLESMTYHPRATRAEVADVANAVLDGCDCTMLSGETAKGKYPVTCVQTMYDIGKEAESATWHRQYFHELSYSVKPPLDPAHAIAIASVDASLKCCAAAIIVVTTSGRSARLISRYRPRCPIITVTRHGKVARQNMIYRGLISLQYVATPGNDWLKDVDMRFQFAIAYGKQMGFINRGDALLLVSGWREGSGFTNTLRIVYASGTEGGK